MDKNNTFDYSLPLTDFVSSWKLRRWIRFSEVYSVLRSGTAFE